MAEVTPSEEVEELVANDRLRRARELLHLTLSHIVDPLHPRFNQTEQAFVLATRSVLVACVEVLDLHASDPVNSQNGFEAGSLSMAYRVLRLMEGELRLPRWQCTGKLSRHDST